jgi:hypothetical protein
MRSAKLVCWSRFLNPIFSSRTDYVLEKIWHIKDAKASKIKMLMQFFEHFFAPEGERIQYRLLERLGKVLLG